MNQHQQNGEPEVVRDFNKADLYQALDYATRLGLMKRAVRDTAKQLVRFIPMDAETPISPVRVARLASEEGCCVKTINNHINFLIKNKYVVNRTLDGGHRAIDRSYDNITFLAGIDLSPLIGLLPQLTLDTKMRDALRAESEATRKRISIVRRQIKTAIAGLNSVPSHLLTAFEALPRRVADKMIDELLDLYTASVDILDELKAIIAKDSVNNTDQSEKNALPYTNTNISSVICNKDKLLIKNAKEPLKAKSGTSISTELKDDSTVQEPITLDLVISAAPSDWIDDANALYGQANWNSLHNVALARADANGIFPKLWAKARDQYGQDTITVLSLILDHHGPGGTDHIKNPAGWMISMLRRVDNGQANLSRSLFGIVNSRSDL